MTRRTRAPIILRVRPSLAAVARHRLLAVGLALAVEAGILVVLAYAEPAEVVGLPAAVAAAIAGTVAVVLGPWDGVAVALGGALVFAAAADWGPGTLAAIVAWPAIVLPVGLFARRVARERLALRRIVEAQEDERRRLALELHDETAQVLAAALMTVRRLEHAESAAELTEAGGELRALLHDTIARVRSLAVELRPKSLDDFGLPAAAERLATSFAERTGLTVELDLEGAGQRLPPERELTLYRTLQDALLGVAARPGVTHARVALERTAAGLVLEVADDGRNDPGPESGLDLLVARERLRLVGGRLAVEPLAGVGRTVRAVVPA